MNFKTEKPEIFQMMGEFYKTVQELYEERDIKAVLECCDDFNSEWICVKGLPRNLVEGLMQGLIIWKDEEFKHGKEER